MSLFAIKHENCPTCQCNEPIGESSARPASSAEEVVIRLYWSPMCQVWRCESQLTTAHGATQEECLRNWVQARYGKPSN